MSETCTQIYELYDPREPWLTMYVGKGFEKRAHSHWKQFVRYGIATNKPQQRWFEKLASMRLEPRVRIREVVILSRWQEREKFWISYWKKLNPNICNVASGGNAPTDEMAKAGNRVLRQLYPELILEVTRSAGKNNLGKKRTLEQRKRMSVNRKGQGKGPNPKRSQPGELNGFFGRTHSTESRLTISEKQKARIASLSDEEREKQFAHNSYPGEKNPFFGHEHTEETKQKMRKPHKKFSGTLSDAALAIRREQAAAMRQAKKEQFYTLSHEAHLAFVEIYMGEGGDQINNGLPSKASE